MDIERKAGKYAYIDVGFHRGQEYMLIWHKTNLRIMLGYIYKTLKRQRIDRAILSTKTHAKEMIEICRTLKMIRKNSAQTKTIAIEPNTTMLKHHAYRKVNYIIPIAIDDITEQLEMKKMYYANGDIEGEGSSIYWNKHNVDMNHYTMVLTLSARRIAELLSPIVDDRDIILRVNCEGSEEHIVKAIHQRYGNRLIIVMGSLKDVGEIHGSARLNQLHEYMRVHGIPYHELSTDSRHWMKTLQRLLTAINE